MRLTISEAASSYGISVRTLHYYDEIGLVKPSEVTQNGYRYYDQDALATLQQVLFYRELEFPLKDIAQFLQNPNYDKLDAMQKHRNLLLLKRQHLDDLLRLVDETIGGKNMSKPKTTLADIEKAKQEYAQEAKERYGSSEAYGESEERYARYTDEDKATMGANMDEIFSGFAALVGQNPEGKEARELVIRWKNHISKYNYPCTDEILSGLGKMYVADERFAKNLDKYGEGTARFMSEAIRAYCLSVDVE